MFRGSKKDPTVRRALNVELTERLPPNFIQEQLAVIPTIEEKLAECKDPDPDPLAKIKPTATELANRKKELLAIPSETLTVMNISELINTHRVCIAADCDAQKKEANSDVQQKWFTKLSALRKHLNNTNKRCGGILFNKRPLKSFTKEERVMNSEFNRYRCGFANCTKM